MMMKKGAKCKAGMAPKHVNKPKAKHRKLFPAMK